MATTFLEPERTLVIKLEMHTVAYKPLGGGSYIKLPKEIANKKAVVNMKNTNNEKCFLWSVLRALNPVKDNKARIDEEGAKKALEAGKSAAVDVGKKLATKALTPKSKKILQKYVKPTTQSTTQDINTLIDGSAIDIQDIVKKLNSGAGIKVVI